jgi:hypothetical protein
MDRLPEDIKKIHYYFLNMKHLILLTQKHISKNMKHCYLHYIKVKFHSSHLYEKIIYFANHISNLPGIIDNCYVLYYDIFTVILLKL